MRCVAITLAALLTAAPLAAEEPPTHSDPPAAGEPLSYEAALPQAYEGMAGEPSLGEKAYDLLLLRPLGAVQLAVGAVVFVPAWPVAWLVGGNEDVYRACIRQPVDRTFRRPLGRL